MNGSIRIKYDPDLEFMEILYNGNTVFFGNYWDFKSDPKYLAAIFGKIGLNTNVEEVSL